MVLNQHVLLNDILLGNINNLINIKRLKNKPKNLQHDIISAFKFFP